jgi:hypothetical protein
MTRRDPEINMSRIQVDGVGGLGLVVMAAVVAYAMPVVRDVTLLGLAGGVVGGAALAIYRWWRADPGSAAKGPTLIGVELRKGEPNHPRRVRHGSPTESMSVS